MTTGSARGIGGMAAPKLSLSEQIAQIPPELQTRARAGFRIAAELDPAKLKEILTRFMQELSAGAADVEAVAKLGGIDKTHANHLVAALALTFGLLSEGSDTLDDYFEAGREKLFDESNKKIVSTVAETAITNRSDIQASMQRISLAKETLPAIIDVDISVDLRFKFEEAKTTNAVPVAILHIDTDARPEIWCQISRGQLQWITERFKEVLRQLEVLEGYAVKIKSGRYE